MQCVSSEFPFTLLLLLLFIIIIDRRKVQPSCSVQGSEGSRRAKRFVPLSKPAIVLSLAYALYFTCLFWASCCCSHYNCWQVAFLATRNQGLWVETLGVQYKEGTDCRIFKINYFVLNMKVLFAVHTHHCLVTVTGQVMHYSCVQRGLCWLQGNNLLLSPLLSTWSSWLSGCPVVQHMCKCL